MPKIKAFSITLRHEEPGNGHALYHSGSTVMGRILVDLSEPIKVTAITVTVIGRAKVEWEKNAGDSATYSAEEIYLNKTIVLWGDPDCGQAATHPGGIHMYDFEVPLAENLPSSFEGAYGKISYSCKATIHRSWSADVICKQSFSLVSDLDLNDEPEEFKKVVVGHAQSDVACCQCVAGEVTAKLRLQKRLFVPGEPILVYAEVHNKSNISLGGSHVSLNQYTSFVGRSGSLFSRGHLKSKETSCKVVIKYGDVIGEGETRVWDNVELRVPPLPPSKLSGCDIMSVHYRLMFSVNVTYGPDIKISADLIIGTIPLHGSYPSSRPTAPVSSVVTRQPATAPSAAHAVPDYNMAPPSYEQCVQQSARLSDEEHDNDDVVFATQEACAPRYAYYDWGASQSVPQGAGADWNLQSDPCPVTNSQPSSAAHDWNPGPPPIPIPETDTNGWNPEPPSTPPPNTNTQGWNPEPAPTPTPGTNTQDWNAELPTTPPETNTQGWNPEPPSTPTPTDRVN